jgi:predicted nucleic acid-binding protein
MIAFDTNILIYCCDEGDARRKTIALDLVSNTEDGILLWQVAGEFVAASRKLGPQGFTAAAAWERLSEFLELFPLVLPAPEVLDRARRLHSEQQVAFWDSMLLAACLAAGVTRLYSEDLPSRASVDTLEIVNPFD